MSSGLGFTLTLIAWWVGTGAVFVAARGGPRRRRWAFVGATAMFGVALTALPGLSVRGDTWAVLLALLAGFAIWAWVEMSFYTGVITGPSRRTPPPGSTLGVRFVHALGACLWHELVIPVVGVVIWLVSPGPNQWALAIFLVFWVLHEAARINVLIGVPHPFEELLPDHLAHLKPYLQPRRASWPIYLSLAAHVAGVVVLVFQALAHAGEPALLGWAALVALVGLGWIEHLVLMLPIPLERLWRSLGMGRQGDAALDRPAALPAGQVRPEPEAAPAR